MKNTIRSTAHLSSEERRALLTRLLQKQGGRHSRPFPLSFAQRRLWFLEQWEAHSPLYNLTNAVLIKGPLQFVALEYSLNEIARRHASLRTIFGIVDEQPVQLILPTLTVSLPVIDLRGLGAAEKEAAIQNLSQSDEVTPFELSEGPLIRAALLHIQDQEYMLLLSMHHIVSDGWSMGVLFQELAQLYNASVEGQPAQLPDLPVQYTDFARWQYESLQGPVLANQLAYWRKQLAGAPEFLDLPLDRPRPASQTFEGADFPLVLSPALSEQLKALSRQEGVTIFMLLLAAFATLLARYSNQYDLLIGTPIANRTRTEIESLIGFFVNTLPLRVDLSNNPDFRQVLARVRDMTLNAYANQDVPFEKLVEELAPARNLSHSPLLQTMFILQNTPRATEHMKDLTVQRLEGLGTTAMFDLTLALIDSQDGFHGGFNYKTALFESSTIARMAEHFQILLEDIVAHPDRKITELALLSQRERSLLLRQWDPVPSGPTVDGCVHALFEEQVENDPHAIALHYEGTILTYDDLNRRSNQLAHLLIGQNVKPASPIAVMLKRGPSQIVALLAILKAGCPFVCFDDQTPALRLQQILAETTPPCILTETACLQEHPELVTILSTMMSEQGTVVLLDNAMSLAVHQVVARDQIERYPDENPDLVLSTGAPAYLAYTSGSTGQPKGIIQSHRNFARFVRWFSTHFHIGPGSRIAQWPSITFDPALAEIFSTLCSGATLFLLSKKLSTDPEAMVAWLQEQRIHFFQTVPGFFRYMLQYSLQQQNEHEHTKHVPFPHLETLIITGEILPVDLAAKVLHFFGDALTLYNLYGPTEVILATSYAVKVIHEGQRSIPVGSPIAGCQVFILDQAQQLCPQGVIGEIFVRGNYVSDGYFRREQENQQAFLQNPLHNDFPDRVYQTGDLGRWLPDGTIEFFGRRDHQVKIRGMRVELEEIEAVLRQHEAIHNGVVIAHRDEQGEQRLVAYIASAQPEHEIVPEIQRYLRLHLPDHMCPAMFVLLEALPLTTSGKINRQALLPPDWKHLDTYYVAPRTPVESIVADIWSELLHLSQIGVRDNFFALGGHSLLATQVLARIRNLFKVELPLQSLFEAPTVEGLASSVERHDTSTQQDPVPAIMQRPQQLPCFSLSFAQERLWFLEQLAQGASLYTLSLSMHIRGTLDIAALERSLHDIARRHEILRTHFLLVAGQPMQTVVEDAPLTLSVRDISHLSDEARAREIKRRAAGQESQPFNLEQGPLWRAGLLRCSMDEHIFLLTMHHSIFDAWSTGIFFRELGQFYAFHAYGTPVNLPALPVQYADFTLWQRQWLQGDVIQRQMSYWKRQLVDAPELLELPVDHPRPAIQTHRGAEYSFKLSEDLTARLKVLSRKEGATLFMTLLSAFALLLAYYSRQDDLVIGTPVANRRHTEVEGLIGFFVNTLALRIKLTGNPSFRQVLALTREVTLGAYTHQDVPFEKLVEELAPGRQLDRSPLFQVMFVLQNALHFDPHLADLKLTPLESQHITARFDLTLMVADSSDGLQATFEYNADLFDNATIQQLHTHFQTLLEQVVAWPDRPFKQFSLLSTQEERQILHHWNPTLQVSDAQLRLLDWLEQPLLHNPDAPAVCFNQQILSFRTLHQQANQMAHVLRSRIFEPNPLIAVCLPRCAELPVALLACLKAGGAYLPLDPSFPVERLAFMLQDARPSLLLTHSSLLPGLQPVLAQQSLPLFCLDQAQDLLSLQASTTPFLPTWPDPLAYVLYTSGSTGTPKGVEIGQQALSSFLHAMQELLNLTPQDRFLAVTTLSFDIAALELFLPLVTGACLILASDSVLADGEGLLALLQQSQASIMQATPITWRLLLEAGWKQEPRLQQLLCGGEAFPPDLREALQQRTRRLWNVYGPTEATIWSTAHELQPDEQAGSVSLGHPLANTRCYVLDTYGQPVPVGVIGEICLGGQGVARGYLRRASLTAERFMPDPFIGEAGARLYCTGDLGYWRTDGRLMSIGRRDGQVKLRGHRIELGEIEALLTQQPGVQTAVVQVRQEQLVAYIVGTQKVEKEQVRQMRQALGEHLPAYMVPAAFVPLSHLPLTLNGKIDRGKLPEPERHLLVQATEYMAPRGSLEHAIATIWQEVLQKEHISIHDNFFDLGGHSLLLARLHNHLRLALNINVSLLELFQYPTVYLLADYIARQRQLVSGFQQGHERAEMRKKLQQQRAGRQQKLPDHIRQEKRVDLP